MTENDAVGSVNRRSALAAIGTGAGTIVGIDALSRPAHAWDRFDVCFRDCAEVWMIVTETDIDHGGTDDPPAVAHVIVEADGEAVCRPVEFTAENATTMPDRFGDSPVVTYGVGADEKILGVLEYNYTSDPDSQFDDPVWCVNANQNDCATTAGTPDPLSAPCVPDGHPDCPAGDYCGGTDDSEGFQVTWEDCETVTVTGSDEGLERIDIQYMRCLDREGFCPDGANRSVENPELPLTIEDQYLAVEDVEYYIAAIDLLGDVEPRVVTKPDDLDCSFDSAD